MARKKAVANYLVWVTDEPGLIWTGRPKRRMRGFSDLRFVVQRVYLHRYSVLVYWQRTSSFFSDVVYCPLFETEQQAKKYAEEWFEVTRGDVRVQRCKDHDDCLRSPKLGRACILFQGGK